MNTKLLITLSLIFLFTLVSKIGFTQADTTITEAGIEDETKEAKKTGFGFAAIPALAYDTDLGFLYGVIGTIFHYGDGSNYPMYNHKIYLEWSRTTKGSGKNVFLYDNRTLIPNGRMNIDVSYLTEQALDFYGFNGYQSYFGDEYLDTENDNYISRLYYRQDRKLLRLKADFQGRLFNDNWRWLAGIVHYGIDIKSVDLNKLNDGKEGDELLPDTASLYDKYVEWGVIPQSQATGGNTNILKLGLVYDSRDNEHSTTKGIWAEAIVLTAPGFLGNDFSYTKISLTHRQYFNLYKKKVTLAYRVNYQGLIAGEIPFYMMPFYFRSKDTKDGLGGSKTLRGIKRNRVVGDGAVLANLEVRYKFLETLVLNQNFSITLSGFADGAQVVQMHPFKTDGVTASYGKTIDENLKEMDYSDESIHFSYGLGLHFAINHNFIVAVDYGMAGNPQDGSSGLYIGLDYLF
ncbi:MAG: BamA/TamA family outer membrane protein [Bacteroidales bacterium]|nr:BamA/TamA family outer membrane protein [Bacteroidales bacterium]